MAFFARNSASFAVRVSIRVIVSSVMPALAIAPLLAFWS